MCAGQKTHRTEWQVAFQRKRRRDRVVTAEVDDGHRAGSQTADGQSLRIVQQTRYLEGKTFQQTLIADAVRILAHLNARVIGHDGGYSSPRAVRIQEE